MWDNIKDIFGNILKLAMAAMVAFVGVLMFQNDSIKGFFGKIMDFFSSDPDSVTGGKSNQITYSNHNHSHEHDGKEHQHNHNHQGEHDHSHSEGVMASGLSSKKRKGYEEKGWGTVEFHGETRMARYKKNSRGQDTSSLWRVKATKEGRQAIDAWQADMEAYEGGALTHRNPLDAPVSETELESGVGFRTWNNRDHDGIDLTANGKVADIQSSAKGRVLYVGPVGGYGLTAIVGHADGSVSLYGHLKKDSALVEANDVVDAKQKIADMGATKTNKDGKIVTGKSIHLHYEQRKGFNVIMHPKIEGFRENMSYKVFKGLRKADGKVMVEGSRHAQNDPPKAEKEVSQINLKDAGLADGIVHNGSDKLVPPSLLSELNELNQEKREVMG